MPIGLAFPQNEIMGEGALYYVSKADKNTVSSFLCDGFVDDVEERVEYFQQVYI